MRCLELVYYVFEIIEAPEVEVVSVIGVGHDEKLLELFWVVASFDDLPV